MASATEVGVDGGAEASNERKKWAENKVYTRKSFRGLKSHNKSNDSTAQAQGQAPAPLDVDSSQKELLPQSGVVSVDPPAILPPISGVALGNVAPKEGVVRHGKELAAAPAPAPASVDVDSSQKELLPQSGVVPSEPPAILPPISGESSGNAALKDGFVRQKNGVKINLGARPKKEMRDLRTKLESELEVVRNWVKKFEGKEAQMIAAAAGIDDGGVKRSQPKVATGGPPPGSRPLHQLSISVLENSQSSSGNVEKEKRTPKANQFYRNSEFLLANDKFPPAESNKKLKSSAKKQASGDSPGLSRFSKQVFKSCSSLLDKLLKHKYGWVFSKPVDAEALGLHDYFDVIKNPMDLGTIKTRLSKNWYKSPREFAEDVRLTFSNAMVYNPPGQDVHVLAEEFSKMFEDKWGVIEDGYMRELRLAVNYEVGLSTPTSRNAPSLLSPSAEMRRNLDRSESVTNPFVPKLKPMSFVLPGKATAPRKPKARDPNKRDMTYDEKEKLSTSLQNLPSEKQKNIIQIIKRRNASLNQNNDEIEVDIDNVDIETLWELDRFVTNYARNLSKNKRKAELASEAAPEGRPIMQEKNHGLTMVEPPKEAKSGQKSAASQSSIDLENQGDKNIKSSSSSSSSSDSGSSSSDSDSEGSSRSGSDVPNSPAAK